MAGVLILVSPWVALGAEQKAPLKLDLPQPGIPQPQFFCGYCHILTYPSVFQKGYETWKIGKHGKYGCVDCHYPPRPAKKTTQTSATGAAAENKHIPQSGPERFAYIPLGGETVKKRPRIIDANCMTANCHGNPEDKFKTKEIKFAEKVKYVHQPHLEKKNQIVGFEVSKESCFLCHFKDTKFAEGRGKCSLCHKLPEKPIQTSGENPITHKMLQDAKVQCGSCHYDLIKGQGTVSYELVFEKGVIKNAIVMGGGKIKKKSCSGCHDQEKILKEIAAKKFNKKLMHEQHVAVKNARCFDCHTVVRHRKTYVEKPLAMREDCSACHPNHHQYQEMLIKGLKREGIPKTPDPMLKAMTNCLGCHVERTRDKNGEHILKASGKTCVSCHTKDHDKMLKDWVDELTNEIKFARELESEAKEILANSTEKISKEKLNEARKMLKEGRHNLRIVEYGNGVHNKKYSMMLLDSAMNNFEDLMDELEEGN
jgi:hypothetical protein